MSNSLPLCQPGEPPGRAWRPILGKTLKGDVGSILPLISTPCAPWTPHSASPFLMHSDTQSKGFQRATQACLGKVFHLAQLAHSWTLSCSPAGLKLTLSGWRFNNLTGIRKLFHLTEFQVWENNWRVVLGGGITWERIERKGSEEAVSYYQFIMYFFFNWETQRSHVL